MNASNVESHERSRTDQDFVLWRFLDHARFMIFRQREKELAHLHLTPEQAQVLDILNVYGATTINEMIQMTQKRHNSISTLIDRMTKRGLVRSTRKSRDKRVLTIELTTEGAELFHQISIESVKSAFACLSTEEKAELRFYLDRVITHAYKSVGQEFREHQPEQPNRRPKKTGTVVKEQT